MLTSWKESYDQPRQHIKKQRHYFANKGPSIKVSGFSSSHVWMWELNYKESWMPKNWYSWTMVLEKTLESPLDCKEIQPVHPKGDQSWVFLGRIDVEPETPLATWCGELTRLKIPWCWERLKARGEEGWQRIRYLDGITNSMEMSLSKLWELWWTGRPGMLKSMELQRVGHDWATELIACWTFKWQYRPLR